MPDERVVNGSVRVGPSKGRQIASTDPDEIQKHLTKEDLARLQEQGVLEGSGWKAGRKSGAEPPVPAGTPAPIQNAGGATGTQLGEDFPGRVALAAAGVTTLEDVRARRDAGTLIEIPGIGEATAAKIDGEL